MSIENQPCAANVILFCPKEKSKREKALDASMSALVEVMQELHSVGKPGLPERVCCAFDDALRDAMRYARDIRAAKVEVRE